ncbi:ATP-binding protein [Pseudomonas kulmbachensis]|uniref:histidine kinase n=1 Tax=Pseudomonas kulmbachensis TaxID=3043408 RepID=A0ABW7LWC1_9PSED
MKLKHFFRPQDASFSTSIAARTLLRSFFVALLLSLLGGLYVYINSSFDREISQRRGYMSGAILEAQRFFTGHEMLLKNLSLAAVRNKPVSPAAPMELADEVEMTLGEGMHSWSLWQTRRELEYLREENINLLYVKAGSDAQAVRLTRYTLQPIPVDQNVLRQLKELEKTPMPVKGEYWFNATPNFVIADSPVLYLFTLLDQRDPHSGWLGLEIEGAEISTAMDRKHAGDFVVINAQGEEIFASALNPGLTQALQGFGGDRQFGFTGDGLWPDYLIMRNQLGYADLQVVYSMEFGHLLTSLREPLLIALLIGFGSALGLGLLVQRIERQLINPAIYRKQALIESEAFSRTVIQTAPVALCVLRRATGAVVLENTLAQQWLGHGRERDQLCHDWIDRAYDSSERNRFDEFSVAGRHLHIRFVATRYKGEDVLLCAFSDISAHKDVEIALEQAKRVADKANDAKTQFLATMSHEIRTPLYGALGTLELLARTQLTPRQQEYVQAIQSSSSTLLQLICDVLDVSKIEAGQLALEVSEFAPLDLIQEVVSGYSAAAQSKGLQLYAHIDPQLPEQLLGDAPRIRQILNNLLSNAVKFTDSGQIVVRVTVDSRSDERVTVSWQVTDTGQGIAQEDQPFLFDPFYQAGSRANVISGTGLGLSICQRLMYLMSGTMSVVSEPGLGSSFTLALPLEQCRAPKLDDSVKLLPEKVFVRSSIPKLAENICGWLRRWGARAQVLRPGMDIHDSNAVLVELYPGEYERSSEVQWPGPVVIACGNRCFAPGEREGAQWHVKLSDLHDLRRAVSQAQGLNPYARPFEPGSSVYKPLGLHVLVAEDNAISRLILKEQLEELGCTVVMASDGLEALELWKHATFDRVLTDVNMPRMNGYELTTQLRNFDNQVPIIGATANAQQEERARCLAVGMDECLVKPFGLSALFICLEQTERVSNVL